MHNLKLCTKCRNVKSLDEFNNNKAMKDGKQGWCRVCSNSAERKTRHANPKKYLQDGRDKSLARKLDVLSAYSNGKPRCNYCGFDDTRALCIGHINDDGAKHRKKEFGFTNKNRSGSGSAIYNWLKTNNYPDGFQVLCFNCNQIKEIKRRQNNYIEKHKVVSFGKGE